MSLDCDSCSSQDTYYSCTSNPDEDSSYTRQVKDTRCPEPSWLSRARLAHVAASSNAPNFASYCDTGSHLSNRSSSLLSIRPKSALTSERHWIETSINSKSPSYRNIEAGNSSDCYLTAPLGSSVKKVNKDMAPNRASERILRKQGSRLLVPSRYMSNFGITEQEGREKKIGGDRLFCVLSENMKEKSRGNDADERFKINVKMEKKSLCKIRNGSTEVKKFVFREKSDSPRSTYIEPKLCEKYSHSTFPSGVGISAKKPLQLIQTDSKKKQIFPKLNKNAKAKVDAQLKEKVSNISNKDNTSKCRKKFSVPSLKGNTKNWRMHQMICELSMKNGERDLLKESLKDNIGREKNIKTPSRLGRRSSIASWISTPSQLEFLSKIHTGLTPRYESRDTLRSPGRWSMDRRKLQMRTLECSKKRESKDSLGTGSDNEIEGKFSYADVFASDLLEKEQRSLTDQRLIEKHRKKFENLQKQRLKGVRRLLAPVPIPRCGDTNKELEKIIIAHDRHKQKYKNRESKSELKWLADTIDCEREIKDIMDELIVIGYRTSEDGSSDECSGHEQRKEKSGT